VYGSAIHAALEHFYKSNLSGHILSLNELLKVYENSWSNEGFISLEHEIDRYNQGKKVLTGLYKKETKQKSYPIYVEKAFMLTVDSLKLKISGRYDAVYSNNNKIEIRDFKTGNVSDMLNAEKRLKESLQMKIYALAWTSNDTVPVDSVSLYFVENDILARSSNINNDKTLEILKTVSSGIRNRQFGDIGQSRLNFENLI
jgi:DNA helicase-2/ATP-dependent DNA helicase PcrA